MYTNAASKAGTRRSQAIDVRTAGYPHSLQAWTMVAVLMVASVFSFVDRQILSLLVDPIRKDLGITDVQMSLLIGPAFALFFCLTALPIGRLVDTRNRLRIAAAGIALWSLATILSGFANTFVQLFAARAAVAVGEAALFPAAHALIADSFPAVRRARPTGVFMFAVALGSGLAFVFGGVIIALAEGGVSGRSGSWFGGLHPWQVVLMSVGSPGLFVAAVTALLPEPGRRGGGGTGDRPGFRSVMAYMIGRGAVYAGLFLSFAMFALAGYGVLAWAPTHLVREMGLPRSTTGLWVGLAVMTGGLSGILGATTLADRLAAAGVDDGKYRIAIVACVAGALVACGLGLATSPAVYVVLLGLLSVFTSTGFALGPVALHEVTPGAMRGSALATYQIAATIIGAGLGPPVVAFVAKTGVGIGGGLSIVAAVAFCVGALGFLLSRAGFVREVRALSPDIV